MSKRLKLALQIESQAEGLPGKLQLKCWAETALQPGVKRAEITVRLVDEEEGRQLNRDYRGKDYATNVLSFTFDEDLPEIEGMPLLGDLVLCAPVVAREAAEQGLLLAAHYAHLIVHGMLHLQGFDHIDDVEADAMEALETRLLAALGINDPYASEKDGAIDD
ncbi:probable rRNA maturation factor [Andreprevotia lacus DSM 23236]|jgi:probable rRNA maturation factor|uniref:Endoribonuclease YbeY n=1 Tax=Andreprevotia lacus DSM 23236 TaxID=1121001 RepID=A0A1W1X1F8_9NEIS|nr:rRNA maturation RNase YbeY [Andreprevotia lacus]SMC17734.1 probable rRNA maturation factor [Andreprevotia lacus DSM 23236]